MSVIIQPFKCQDVLLKLGYSCKQQEEIYNNLYNLNTGVTTLAPNSVAIGSGLGDASWNEALNYEQIQEEIIKKQQEQAKKNSVGYLADLESKNKKKDYIAYGVALVLILGVVIYELKKRR